MKTTEKGRLGEEAVCRYLTARGCTILARNFHVPGGEIDIVACDAAYLRIVEVKTRKPNSMTTGAQAVDMAKQRRLIAAAALWCQANPSLADEKQLRFDVAEVEMAGTRILSVRYIKGAFDATGSEYYFS